MSLVHESLIGVLNRRFVSSHFNAFPGPGHDAEALAFCRKSSGALTRKSPGGGHVSASGQAGSPRYGAIYAPDGEMLASFGYEREEFYSEIVRVLREHPEWAQPTPEEAAVFAAADALDAGAAACLQAARLATELLEFDRARTWAARAFAASTSDAQRARARYCQGHVELLDLGRKDLAAARAFLTDTASAPPDLRDDIALDLMELDVELAPRRGFFPGWRFADGVDLAARAAELERWIAAAPESNRIGQMHFYLGMARMGAGDAQGADAIWRQHVDTYPDDRYAMLSRVHHTSYQFSPHGGGRGVMSMDDLSQSPELAERLRKLLEGGGVRIQGTDGLPPEMAKRLREQLLEQLGGGGDEEAETETEEPAPEPEEPLPSDDPPPASDGR